ncbi:precorrin-3B C(17)-methyltransferase [Streptomyces sp. NBC_00316]|uniref:precorrin-3B C(17)-methyltransferase n=1 Tax=Streptomyces sp. NBC_00316 TaxID=2975710 RepID=UPI002E2CFFEA|nr:precorrin-3B C(17)-methyltransferase [Streptomyces sp. NBC_00316]
MTWMRPRLVAVLPLALLAVLTAGCADPAAGPRAGGPAASSAAPKGYCPLPEERRATPSPCITFDWNARVAENHGYREQLPITAAQKEEAAPTAKKLATALAKLADTGTTKDGLRSAAAVALGLRPEQVEMRGDDFAPLRDALVGGGAGRVCVNGTVDNAGHADAEVVGRTVEGTCLPGLGGH